MKIVNSRTKGASFTLSHLVEAVNAASYLLKSDIYYSETDQGYGVRTPVLKARVSKDGGAFVASTNLPVWNTSKVALLTLTASEMNANNVVVQFYLEDAGTGVDDVILFSANPDVPEAAAHINFGGWYNILTSVSSGGGSEDCLTMNTLIEQDVITPAGDCTIGEFLALLSRRFNRNRMKI
jgi:hypothetical protein